jgi:hypothetical protein
VGKDARDGIHGYGELPEFLKLTNSRANCSEKEFPSRNIYFNISHPYNGTDMAPVS